MTEFASVFNYYPCYFCGRLSDDGGYIQYHGKTVKICPGCDYDANTDTITTEEDLKCK